MALTLILPKAVSQLSDQIHQTREEETTGVTD
ncbi:hypothetical protein F4561_002554 [Lipingzhangella halophila]|uniref:Uncharacterized protein n=1 Tax=Lipingzhangella halophila TaxID=1783352 RepID=A0A7W7RGU3_9ACTN|nr:hypothetical protein [Lipingzhangella halophila]